MVALAAYGTACIRLLMALKNDTAIQQSVQLICGAVGGISHLWLALHLMQTSVGIDFSLVKSVSLISALAVLIVTFSSQRAAIQAVQLVVMPMATILMVSSPIATTTMTPLDVSAGTVTHALLSITAYGVFTIAAALALLLGYAQTQLRHHHLNSLVRHIPPIEALESLIFEMLATGSLLLGLSIVSGLIYLEDIFAQHLIHKTVLSIAALAVYAALSAGHWLQGWRGKAAMRWIAGAYLLLTLAYVGSKLVLEWVLHTSS